MRATFDNTVSILVKAYFNDELAHKLCCACAVGNIVANALGTKPKRLDNPEGVEFDNMLFEDGQRATDWYDYIKNERFSAAAERQVRLTGYTASELNRIEGAFEQAPGEPNLKKGLYRGKCVDPDWMFNGLMAVVETLADIHGVDLETSQNAKKLFIKI